MADLRRQTEISYHPGIVIQLGRAKTKVLTFSEDLVIGPTIGHVEDAVRRGRRSASDVSSLSKHVAKAEASRQLFTIHFGGGAIGYVTKNLGIRGDLRYLRAYGIDFAALEAENFSLKHFDFWRLNIGLVAKF
jgi:hypothetical protein